MARYIRVWGAYTWAIRSLALMLCAIHIVAGQPGFAAEPKFPQLSGRVVDEATLLSAPARERITGWLEAFERASKRQVVVVTVKDLQGYPIEDFGYDGSPKRWTGLKGSRGFSDHLPLVMRLDIRN